METSSIIIIALLAVTIILLLIVLIRGQSKDRADDITDAVKAENVNLRNDLIGMVNNINDGNQKNLVLLGDQIKEKQNHFGEIQRSMNDSELKLIDQMQDDMNDRLETMYRRMESLETSNKDSLEKIRNAMNESLREVRDENSKKLDEIKGTVDEKLQTTLEKRISESFKTVSDQLAQVYEGIGQMKSLANDVGGLKKVLSGVKTRGILGEIQLGAILEEILSPEQYETNVATVPGSTERVEFAVKLPGPDGTVFLPIDSKFAGERYQQLIDAQETGNKLEIEEAYKALENELKKEAKDIREKYVSVPYTTNFGIMFLPFEGLYAEVVNRGLLEKLQKDGVNVAGPSTMAALLNSLQMGFRTLAIQKRSNEVWTLLGAVKTEFEKFEEVAVKMQTHLNQTSKDLDTLIGTRTKAINRKLREVQSLGETDTSEVLGIDGISFTSEDEE